MIKAIILVSTFNEYVNVAVPWVLVKHLDHISYLLCERANVNVILLKNNIPTHNLLWNLATLNIKYILLTP